MNFKPNWICGQMQTWKEDLARTNASNTKPFFGPSTSCRFFKSEYLGTYKGKTGSYIVRASEETLSLFDPDQERTIFLEVGENNSFTTRGATILQRELAKLPWFSLKGYQQRKRHTYPMERRKWNQHREQDPDSRTSNFLPDRLGKQSFYYYCSSGIREIRISNWTLWGCRICRLNGRMFVPVALYRCRQRIDSMESRIDTRSP
jgi:hypothetical protein